MSARFNALVGDADSMVEVVVVTAVSTEEALDAGIVAVSTAQTTVVEVLAVTSTDHADRYRVALRTAARLPLGLPPELEP